MCGPWRPSQIAVVARTVKSFTAVYSMPRGPGVPCNSVLETQHLGGSLQRGGVDQTLVEIPLRSSSTQTSSMFNLQLSSMTQGRREKELAQWMSETSEALASIAHAWRFGTQLQ